MVRCFRLKIEEGNAPVLSRDRTYVASRIYLNCLDRSNNLQSEILNLKSQSLPDTE